MNPAHKKGLQAYKKASAPGPSESSSSDVSPARFPQFKKSEEKSQVSPPVSKPKAMAKLGEGSLRKVAKFLILLGKDEALKVVRHLSPEEVEALGKEIAGIPKIDPLEADKLLQEFGYISGARSKALKGGKDFAKSILSGAFGAEKGQKILKKAVPGSMPPPFAFLSDLDEGAIVTLLGGEPIHVLTIVLFFLPKEKGAKVLSRLDKGLQKDLVLRWAKMEKVGQEVVHAVETSLKEKLSRNGTSETWTIDGKTALAAILTHLDMGKEEAILQNLEKDEPEVGADIRRRLFTTDHILRIRDEDMEEILRSMTDEDIALVLLSCSPELEKKITLNISTRRLSLVLEEKDLASGRPGREMQRAYQTFLDRTRELVRSGDARILDSGEDWVE